MTSLEASDEDDRDPDLYVRTVDATFEAIRSVQLCIGHVVVKVRSYGRSRYSFDTHIDVRCQNSGKYRPHKNKKGLYKTSTRKTTECPFLAEIRWDGALERYEYNVIVKDHNHDPVSEVLGSSLICRTIQGKFGLDK
ncbi:hypothetical protein SEPCBS57363_002122 [Sporothrix epigloea]|uniref:FAR1 domain-containing protein n=1 Tax=Sporothrix epigloea TaxID=1892477 RepID=A0ABP0DFC3_9PEZI